MRKIRLQKMRIVNFKGISDLAIDFDGKNTLISGYNGTGKSTIADAYFWLTAGKNTALATKFEVRPRDKDNNEVHDVITTVESTFTVFENYHIPLSFTLRRDERENLTDKERQALKPETIAKKKSFYFIDGAPYPENLFYGKVSEFMCDKNKLMLLSNPMAFFALDDKEQREILTAACGDVADSEIDGYDKVKEICGVNAPVTMRDGLTKSISVANKRLKEIPARVDSLAELCDEYADYDKQIAELEKEQTEIEAQGEKLKAELIHCFGISGIMLPPEPSDAEKVGYNIAIRTSTYAVRTAQENIKKLEEYAKKAKCPNCGFAIREYKDEIKKAQAELAEVELKHNEAIQRADIACKEYERDMQEYLRLKDEQAKADKATAQERKNLEACLEKLRARHTELSVEISKLQQAKQIQAQIKALRDEQRTLDSELADDMTKFDIISAFLIRKVETVVENINKRFERVKFRLFNMQTNGELKPCCKALIDGVSYANTNTASKVQVGIELIKLLSEFYGVIAPVWVDDKESVIDLPSIDAQTICLKVDEQYQELHIKAV